MSQKYIANSDYEVVDRCPLELNPSDSVKIGPKDAAWPGWVWVNAADGRGSFVPESHLEVHADGQTATVLKAFNARDLSIKKSEIVTALREVNGWLWCANAAGQEGWLPTFVLKAV
jgi:hypothetical protein